jgi:peptidoglycan/LPS O-acetylase OafA/YrhL
MREEEHSNLLHPTPPLKKQINYLEGLRGMAALSVLNCHWIAHLIPALKDTHHLVFFLTSHGPLAVTIFFLLVRNHETYI